MRKSNKQRIVWLITLIPALLVIGFVVWALSGPALLPDAEMAARSDPRVQVGQEPWLVFDPGIENVRAGLVFYPGGKVEPLAYAPAARALAEQGFLVVITPMPLNLAFFAPDRAEEVMAAYPEVAFWAIGGHSLGGAMAARFAARNPDRVDGLLLWAAYPAASDDLSSTDLQVLSVYGTRDGLATLDEIDTSRALLPAGTTWVAIEGGNHTQFAWIDTQPGDLPASIGLQAQQDQIVAASATLLASLGGSRP